MENKVELKVNIINQLRLFKQSTFKDVLCFLDEDIQNAQRAKATEVRITTNFIRSTLIIENNGKILDNPQSLFSIAESGWDNDVMENENPFGIGFFSNISVSDNIEIFSGDSYIMFDANEMIKTGHCELNVQKTDEYYDGFKLVFNNFNYDNISTYSIEKRVRMLGKYIHELNIYYNDNLQEKKDLSEPDDDYTFKTIIETKDIKGWIAINSNYAFESNLNIYYKGRFVSKLNNFNYLKGDIHINDRILNLTSPDRKDIIKDKKYDDFRDLLNMYTEDLAENAYFSGKDKEIEKYCNAIGYYIDKKKLVKNTKFAVYTNEKIEYLQSIALDTKKNPDENINTFEDYNCYLDKQKSNQGESHFDEIVVQEKMAIEVEIAKGSYMTSSSSSFTEGKLITPEIKNSQIEERDGEFITQSNESVFWIGFDEIYKYEQKFNVIKHYGIKLIVARNKVEQEILKCIPEDFKVYHISKLFEKVTFKSTISNTNLNTKERRALMIFDMVSRIFNGDHNFFSIGDVMTTKTICINNTDIQETIVDEDVVIIKDSALNKVYVDRSVINLCNLCDSLEEDLNIKDIQFILKNFNDICKSIELLIGKNIKEIKTDIISAIANVG